MLILGLSSFEHDPAAAILNEGKLEAAIEEKKLSRFAIRGVPQAAIRYCLTRAPNGWDSVDVIAFAARPGPACFRKSAFRLRRAFLAPIGAAYYTGKEIGILSRELNNVRMIREMTGASRSKVLSLDHHLCHAAAAFYTSLSDRALILTMDEEGDGWSCAVAVGEGNKIRSLRKIPFPHSLGWVFSQATALLGFRPHSDEHKLQWLSLGGEPIYRDLFLDLLRKSSDPHPHLNFKYFNRGLSGMTAFSPEFYAKVGLNPRAIPNLDSAGKAIASSLQSACAQVTGDLLEFYCRREKISDICLGGGLFENTLLVSDIQKRFGDHVFVPPAPSNAGTAIGAAYVAWHQISGKPRCEPLGHIYLGPRFTGQDIKDVLDNCKSRYRYLETEQLKVDAIVELLLAGKIAAWYQGASEFGGRALGNRSLLASPWAPYVRENLNDFVKHREWFRPFALSVTQEDCSQWFEANRLARFMSSLATALPCVNGALREFLLPGDRVRLQVVERAANPLYWRLLKRFGECAPAPILVNTSFNLFGEPLVVTPRDAVRSYYCSGIDALMIGNFLLKKD